MLYYCYAHSASNLLRSYNGIKKYVNVLDTIVVNETGASGGDPSGVLKSLLSRKGKCKRNGKVYIVRDRNDAQVSMCLFPDKSYTLSDNISENAQSKL